MRKMSTGIWNSIKNRTSEEFRLAKEEYTGNAMREREFIKTKMNDYIEKGSDVSEIFNNQPGLTSSFVNSLKSSGARTAGYIGAGTGALYGGFDHDTSVIGGAIKGASLGYGLKSLQGIVGERRTLMNKSMDEINKLGG